MEHSLIELGDLPDEILLVILKKLQNIEVLNSVIDVNKRLNRIGGDRTFTSHLSLMTCSSNNSLYRPLSEPMLNRFCSQISPEIHDKINWLDLESTSMQRILVTKYPSLNRLGLYDIDVEEAMSLFGKLFFRFIRTCFNVEFIPIQEISVAIKYIPSTVRRVI